MGHKSRNCTSQSAITIMKNWGGDEKEVTKHLYICSSLTPLLRGVMKSEPLEGRQQGDGEERRKSKQWASRVSPRASYSACRLRRTTDDKTSTPIMRAYALHLGASQVPLWFRICLSMQERRVWSLGQEDSLEKEMATHSIKFVWDPMDRGAWRATVHGSQRAGHDWACTQARIAP